MLQAKGITRLPSLCLGVPWQPTGRRFKKIIVIRPPHVGLGSVLIDRNHPESNTEGSKIGQTNGAEALSNRP